MIKNRFFTAFAFAGLIGFAACAAEDDTAEFEDTAPLEEAAPAPAIEPAPLPVTVDSLTVTDTTIVDSVTM